MAFFIIFNIVIFIIIIIAVVIIIIFILTNLFTYLFIVVYDGICRILTNISEIGISNTDVCAYAYIGHLYRSRSAVWGQGSAVWTLAATCSLHVGLSLALVHKYPCWTRLLFRFGKPCSRENVMHSLYNGSSSLDSWSYKRQHCNLQYD